MRAGVSTACLYPDLLENTLLELVVSGINHVEIFLNTTCELERNFVQGMSDMLKRYNSTCRSVHPFTCAMEPMMFFSVYERRVDDMLEIYKRFFEAMNILEAEIFVFHGNNPFLKTPEEIYFERYSRLVKTGREFGITVAQENVSRCQSGPLAFQKNMLRAMGSDAKFVLDTKQAQRAGEDPFKIVDELGTAIVHVHLSDCGKKGDCLPLGKGEFDIKGFIGHLSEYGFDGSVIIELYRSNFSDVIELADNFNELINMIESVKQGRIRL